MNKVIKVYRQEVPAMRFIGKKYHGEEGFTHWGDFFVNGWFDAIENAMGGVEKITDIWEDGGGYVGVEFRKDGVLTDYWIGMFTPAGTEVPEGFEYVDFDKGNIGVCWNYAKEEDVRNDLGENWKYIINEGMEFWTDDTGAIVQFENDVCPRYTTPDEKGNVILDFCFYVK